MTIVVLAMTSRTLGQNSQNDDWIPLFNGQNFDGWYTYLQSSGKNQDPNHVFQIHDKTIHLYKDNEANQPAPVGYFASDLEYSYYHLQFQYKWGNKRFAPRAETVRDTGLLYHAASDDGIWPRSIECQIQEHDVGDCYLVYGTQLDSMVDPQTLTTDKPRFLDAIAGGVPFTRGTPEIARIVKYEEYEINDWNTVEVIVRGCDSVVHIVNGKVNFRATNLRKLGADKISWLPLTHGRIIFQAEYAEVLYRNIKIRAIPDGPLFASSTVVSK